MCVCLYIHWQVTIVNSNYFFLMSDLRKKNRLRPAFKPTCKPRSAKASFFLKKKSRQNMYRYKLMEEIKTKTKKEADSYLSKG